MDTVAMVAAILLCALLACSLAYHLGRIKGAEEVRDAMEQDPREVTRRQCRACLRDVSACSCPNRWKRGA